jgi:hypothetical protein
MREFRPVTALTLLEFLGWAGALVLAMALAALVIWLIANGTGPGGPGEL